MFFFSPPLLLIDFFIMRFFLGEPQYDGGVGESLCLSSAVKPFGILVLLLSDIAEVGWKLSHLYPYQRELTTKLEIWVRPIEPRFYSLKVIPLCVTWHRASAAAVLMI